MYKFIAVVAILGLTACGSSNSAESTTADSTATVAPVTVTADSVVTTDSSVSAPTTGENAK
jgi:hypothetical protein